MNLNEIAISTIKSQYLKNFIQKNEIVFTPENVVAMIVNSDISLSEKYSMLSKIYYEYKISDIDKILINIEFISSILVGKNDNFVISFEPQYNEINCAKSIDVIKEYIEKHNIDLQNENKLSIYNVNTAELVATVMVTEKVIPYTYEVIGEISMLESELADKYFEIKSDINIGDVVHVFNDKNDTKYVVTSVNRDLNSELGLRYTTDNELSLVDINELGASKDYSRLINSILKQRINSLDTDKEFNDIIMNKHIRVHITMIEK